jgi:TATA-binding protein-associated factor Taf7
VGAGGEAVTREDIIRWAREVEDYADTIYQKGEYHPGWVEVRDQRFAALVAEAEREACAKIVYGLCVSDNNAQEIVNAIRARGSK